MFILDRVKTFMDSAAPKPRHFPVVYIHHTGIFNALNSQRQVGVRKHAFSYGFLRRILARYSALLVLSGARQRSSL